jgi:hypothetical protein
MWKRVNSLSAEIKGALCSSTDRESLGNLVSVLKNMQIALRQWSKQNFGADTEELNRPRKELEEARVRTMSNQADIRAIIDRMDELLYREEMMRLQHSRVSWLKYGDRNTSYFHRQAQWRARKNKIKKLKKADCTWCETPREMKQMVVQYFADLYSAEQEVQPNRVLHLIEPKITQEMNEDLCRHFTENKISDALFQMGPLKALGPDGFLARFF